MTQSEPGRGSRSADVLAVVRVILGAILGWMIWWASPLVTGEIEPWDSFGSYYSTSLVAAGLLSTLLWPSGWYWGPVGVYAGQIAYVLIAYDPGGPIVFPAPIAVGLFGTLQSIVGGLIGMGVGLAFAIERKSRC